MSNSATRSRIALVIGNANYARARFLRNTPLDTEGFSAALIEIGFTSHVSGSDGNFVELLPFIDQTLIDMKRLLADFSIAAQDAEMAIIYYSGHGIEIDFRNYLIPIDAELNNARRIVYETIPLSEVIEATAGAEKLRLIILDACRDNPFKGEIKGLDQGKSINMHGVGLSVDSGNALIFYATTERQVAREGEVGDMSPFAKALSTYIRQPGLELNRILGKVTNEVRTATRNAQEPRLYGPPRGEELYFKTLTPPETVPSPTLIGRADVVASDAVSRSDQVDAVTKQKRIRTTTGGTHKPSLVINVGLAAVGLLASAGVAIAIAGYTRVGVLSFASAFAGAGILFVSSTLLNSLSGSNRLAGQFLTWMVVLTFITFLSLTTTAIVSGWPCDLAEFLSLTTACSQAPPTSAQLVVLKNPQPNQTSFRIKSDPYQFLLAYDVTGSYLVKGKEVSIKLNGGSVSVSTLVPSTQGPLTFPMALAGLVVGLCYNTPRAIRNFYPANSPDVRLPFDKTIDVGQSLPLPTGDLKVKVPVELQHQSFWLCGQLYNKGGAYFPSE
jgi:uncharacterized caspase-like protein